MTARPSLFPDWAMLDKVSPDSGQNNSIEPPLAWKNYGWDYQEKPARNYINWLGRITSNWIHYLDEQRGMRIDVAASDAPAAVKALAAAVCDGTNDEVEINAAISALGATGGTVRLSMGTFSVKATINLVNNLTLLGDGINSTTIKVAASVAADVTMLTGAAKNYVRLSGFTLDGNSGSIGAYNIIGVTMGSNAFCDHVRVKDMKYTASGGTGIQVTGSDGKLLNCEAANCDTYGFHFTSTAHYATVVSCSGNGNARSGSSGCVKVEGHNFQIIALCSYMDDKGVMTNANDNGVILGCRVIKPQGTGGICVVGGSYCVVVGNSVDQAEKDGIYVSQHASGVIADNIITASSRKTDDSYAGIEMYEGQYHSVHGNLIRKAGAGNMPHAGIECAAAPHAPTSVRVFGNDLQSSAKTGGNEVIDTAGSVKTIPAWCGTGAATNAQNSWAAANLS